jgi:thioredoxin 2
MMSETPLIRCPSCGATNRVSREAEEKIERGLAPVCGRCKSHLTADARPVTVTDATFADEVERSPLPVVLDVWAAWCRPCLMIAPVIDQLTSELAGRVRFAKPALWSRPHESAKLPPDTELPVLRGRRR